jgi:hypothetical protein
MNVKPSKKGGLITIQSQEIENQISSLPKENRSRIEEANTALNEMMDDVNDFESEQRIRKAGFSPQEAEDIAYMVRDHRVGQIFTYNQKSIVLTPFNTVVDAQVYLTAIQDRLLELTTVPTEVEISNLKKTIQEFTSLSFFGLIKLAFTNLLTNLTKGKSNG